AATMLYTVVLRDSTTSVRCCTPCSFVLKALGEMAPMSRADRRPRRALIPRSQCGTGRCAFTVIEMIVALAVSASVVLVARVILENLGPEASRVIGAATSAHTDVN